MKICCNGEEFQMDGTKTLAEFIGELGLAADSLVVEYNGRIIPKEERETMLIEEGSNLELIRFVGGGSRSC